MMIKKPLDQRISLTETLDRILNKGVMITGDVIISVANIDLIYLQLNVLVCSIETAMKRKNWFAEKEEEVVNA